MAKKAILDVLESTIGRYVLDLDAQSLNVAVWSGKIELNSLHLNVEAVNLELARQAAEAPNLAVPFRVTDGSFTSLRVDVPWTNITSKPVVLRAKGLKIFVEPYNFLSPDNMKDADIVASIHAAKKDPKAATEKAKKKKKSERVQSLNHSEQSRQRANAVRKLAYIEEGSKRDSTGSSFGAKLVRRIAENLQFDVDDVHIALRGCGCSAGVVLESLSLATTDEKGRRTFVDRVQNSKNIAASFLYKSLDIKGLGIYLDELKEPVQLAKTTTSSSLDRAHNASHSYILSPLSFEAKLRQSDFKECIDFPKYLLSAQLSNVSFLLSRHQLELGNKIALAIQPGINVARPLFPEYRPSGRVNTVNAKEWWAYAVRCIGRLNRSRSWTEYFFAFQKRKAYIPLYKRAAHHSTCPWLKPLSSTEVHELDAIEKDKSISVDGIMCWRSIADAQVELETKKKEAADYFNNKTDKKNFMGSLFGGPRSNEVAAKASSQDKEDPPITLTIEEVKALEAISLEQAADDGLSSDSQLCDIKFTLGSFKVNLVSYGMRPLAALQMGTVDASMLANKDGSFGFHFQLSSLEVDDMVTPKSLFPSVLRSLQTLDSSCAFDLCINKSRSGDQDVKLMIVAFEMVSSPMMITEIKDFFTLSNINTSAPTRSKTLHNPMMAQSMSGSIDLFYDADMGASMANLPKASLVEGTAAAAVAAGSMVSDTISSAIADAWKNKNKTKKTWTMDCDISAPIILLPENCTDPQANVLVFDLGNLHFVMGKSKPSTKVHKWFESQSETSGIYHTFDEAVLELKHLCFKVGRAGDLNRKKFSTEAGTVEETRVSDTVIEPVSLVLNIGIERNKATDNNIPRTCVFGNLPAISFKTSPSQTTRILYVTSTWQSFFLDLTEKEILNQTMPFGGVPILEEGSHASLSLSEAEVEQLSPPSSPFRPKPGQRKSSSAIVAAASKTNEISVYPTLYINIALRRLSAKISTDHGDSIEAHLVSVVASSSILSDGSSLTRLCMGWFWLLDMLNSDYIRRQRLVAHSNLPQLAEVYAQNNSYDIMTELTKIGAFEDNYEGSSDLADITVENRVRVVKATEEFKSDKPNQREDLFLDSRAITVVDAKFTSLFINWNPHAVKGLLNMQSALMDFQSRQTISDPGTPHRQDYFSPQGIRKLRTLDASSIISSDVKIDSSQGLTVIRAKMKSFEVSLNSAKDDLPLFTLIMADADVRAALLSHEGHDNMKVNLAVGDVRMQTPHLERMKSSYQTILGLSPNQSTCILKVEYNIGPAAIQSCVFLNGLSDGDCDSCAEVDLSPVRFVYIQAQVLTLVEYLTEGVLGTIVKVTSSAATAAAREAAQAIEKQKIFIVKAAGLDLIIPQAAESDERFYLRSGLVDIEYRALENQGGAKARLQVNDISMECNRNDQMVRDPIQMAIEVTLAPTAVISKHDGAIRATISISEAYFIVTKRQYAQVFAMLEGNIGEIDPYLRSKHGATSDSVSSEDNIDIKKDEEEESAAKIAAQRITHGGVMVVEVVTRIYVDLKVETMAMELCGESEDDPIICMKAVQTKIRVELLPDKKQLVADITLHNLVCEDRRLQAMDRNFRSLITQSLSQESDLKDVFHLSYNKYYETETTDVQLTLNSTTVILLPDVISEVLQFVNIDSKRRLSIAPVDDADSTESHAHELNVSGEDGAVEIFEAPTIPKATMKVSLKTGDCRIFMVDMGSDSHQKVSDQKLAKSMKSASQVTEVVVLQGKLDAHVELNSDMRTGKSLDNDIEVHGSHIQVYTAHGKKLAGPISILEPAEFSAFLTTTVNVQKKIKELEMKLVTLTPVDIFFSMQNAALLNAILSSLTASILSSEILDEVEDDLQPLTEEETARIQRLANAFEKPDGWDSDNSGSLSRQNSSVGRKNTSIYQTARATETQIADDDFGCVYSLKVTLPAATVTVINDLQGLDEALFRLIVTSFVAGGAMDVPSISESFPMTQAQKTTFNFHVCTSCEADFLDTSAGTWKKLLDKPWELTLNGSREKNHRDVSDRLSSVFDIESQPCHISFTENFLVSLGAASRMWNTYSAAMEDAIRSGNSQVTGRERKQISSLRQSMAACAARSLISTFPYAIENNSGLVIRFAVVKASGTLDRVPQPIESGSIKQFRFDLRTGNGIGGKRLYGEEVSHLKTIAMYFGDKEIRIKNLDVQIGNPRQAHDIGNGQYIFSTIKKTGRSVVLRITSQMDMINRTKLPFQVLVNNLEVGNIDCMVMKSKSQRKSGESVFGGNQRDKPSASTKASRSSNRLGIPVNLLDSFNSADDSSVVLTLSPILDNQSTNALDDGLFGTLVVPRVEDLFDLAKTARSQTLFEVSCKDHQVSEAGHCRRDSLVLQVCCKVSLVDNHLPFVELILQPRAKLENRLPISLDIRTPMPHIYLKAIGESDEIDKGTDGTKGEGIIMYTVQPFESIEIFTPGPSIAISVKCSDPPTGGGVTGWSSELGGATDYENSWVDIPLGIGQHLSEPVQCVFPFVHRSTTRAEGQIHKGGSEFFIAEVISGNDEMGGVDEIESLSATIDDETRVVCLTVCNVGIDHTGDLLFEHVTGQHGATKLRKSASSVEPRHNPSISVESAPFSAFSSNRRRITLLPDASTHIRLIQLTMHGETGMQKSVPFCLGDIALSRGGIESTTIQWETGASSGLFAYRRLSSSNQSEFHVIPEFVIFNSSTSYKIAVKQPDGHEIILGPERVSTIRRDTKQELVVTLSLIELGGSTLPIKVHELGLKVCIVKALDGSPIGSLAVQTVIGSLDARLVVKIGQMNYRKILAGDTSGPIGRMTSNNIFAYDAFRFRVRWSEMAITLTDTQREVDLDESEAFKNKLLSFGKKSEGSSSGDELVTKMESVLSKIIFDRFTVDFQRIFKEEEANSSNRTAYNFAERSQLAIVIHNILVTDCTPNTPYPVVFNSSTSKNFFDLCVRTRGPLNAELVKVDLFDLNLAYSDGKSDVITLSTCETYVWSMLDVYNRTMMAISRLAGSELQLDWDEESGGYIVSVAETGDDDFFNDVDTDGVYRPPKSDRLFDVKVIRISPIKALLSFKRQPHASRYKLARRGQGGRLTNYFLTRLKFTIRNGEMKFAGYLQKNIKGPPDRLLEIISAVYLSQMKFILITLMSAVSLQDWKHLTAREGGGDSFMEGDILRLTGNLAGRSAGYMLKKVGEGLGDGVSIVTSAVGSEVQYAAERVGAGAVGAGVNSVVSGVGDGVSSTVKGVGKGAGSIVRGGAKGIGQIAGGVGGGVLLAGKGIGKGITTGDGAAVASGLGNGAMSIGKGVGTGIETIAVGAADGVVSVGKGVFKGVNQVAKGIGGVFSRNNR